VGSGLALSLPLNLILYSFEWGREKSTAWLTAFLLSFLESVIVIQPVKVTFMLVFFAVEYSWSSVTPC